MCRVLPDVSAVGRAFDYSIPERFAEQVEIGSIIRMRLHGRSVRGFVLDVDIEPETDRSRLLPVDRVSSVGPGADLLELSEWASWRWAGPRVTFLRAASPPNNVAPNRLFGVAATVAVSRAGSTPPGPTVVRWPPAGDRRELILERVARDGSTIICTPEPGRARSLVVALERAGRDVVVFDPADSDADRTRAWTRAHAGRVVVIGGRSASLAPGPDLHGAIVLDEGDDAFESERAPTWNAREMLVERSRRCRAAVTLVAPAPSLEALALAEDRVVAPPPGVERGGWPPLEVVDRREQPPGEGLFSGALADALHGALDDGGRAWCVLNRRGRARMLVCRRCGAVASCEQCGAAVAEASSDDTSSDDTSSDDTSSDDTSSDDKGGKADAAGLECPRCGTTRPRVCAACFSTDLRRLRSGVTRLREELEALLPRTPVGLVDAGHSEDLSAPLLVGTEALFHADVPAPRLVAFLDFDQELLAGRYRAGEQAMTLLVRAGRAVGLRGRGRVLVQTRTPEHEVLRAASSARPTIASEIEEQRRRELGYPPFGGLAEIRGSGDAVAAVVDRLRDVPSLRIDGPATTPSRRGTPSMSALVRAPAVEMLADALRHAGVAASGPDGVRVDLDPRRV